MSKDKETLVKYLDGKVQIKSKPLAGENIPVDDNGEIDLAIQNKIYSEYYKLIQIKKNLENILEKYSI